MLIYGKNSVLLSTSATLKTVMKLYLTIYWYLILYTTLAMPISIVRLSK